MDCGGAVDAVDALKVLRHVAGLPVSQSPGCPAIVSAVASLFGDVDCGGDIDAVDALLILRHVAGLPVDQQPGCPAIGSSASVASASGSLQAGIGLAGMAVLVLGGALVVRRGRRRYSA